MDKLKKERIKKWETLIWDVKKERKITKTNIYNKYKKKRKKGCNEIKLFIPNKIENDDNELKKNYT